MCVCVGCLYLEINDSKQIRWHKRHVDGSDTRDARCHAILFANASNVLRIRVNCIQGLSLTRSLSLCSFNLCFDIHLVWPLNIFNAIILSCSQFDVCVCLCV